MVKFCFHETQEINVNYHKILVVIAVLKPNSTLADRGASSNPVVPEQQPSEAATPG